MAGGNKARGGNRPDGEDVPGGDCRARVSIDRHHGERFPGWSRGGDLNGPSDGRSARPAWACWRTRTRPARSTIIALPNEGQHRSELRSWPRSRTSTVMGVSATTGRLAGECFEHADVIVSAEDVDDPVG